MPTNLEAAIDYAPAQVDIDAANAALNSVIELKARAAKRVATDASAVTRETGDLVTVRAKPEKRKNAQQRAKERNEEHNKERTEAVDTPAATPETAGLATAHPKPEKRKNAKEKAREKFAKDRTTPDMTAKAKFKAETKKAKSTKSAAHKAA